MADNRGVASDSVDAVSELTHDAEDGDLEAMTTPTGKRTTPAFQFYPKEFLSSSKVLRMSNTEVGIYIKLLCIAWLDNGLPNDVAKIAPIVGMRRQQFERIWSNVLHECFVEKNGKLTNPRQERQRKELADYRRQQKENAVKGWQGRRNAVASPPQSQTDALQSAICDLPSASSEKIDRVRSAPIVRRRNPNAAFEGARGLTVLHGQHQKFLDLLNGRVSEPDLLKWYESVAEDWATGAHRDDTPDPNAPKFWDARFAERWPPTAPKSSRLTAWRPEGVA